MNHQTKEIQIFFKTMMKNSKILQGKNAWLAPQAVHIERVRVLGASCNILVGAQNCSDKNSGAYTGEVSPLTLKEIGCSFTILGHSERRTLFSETDEIINKKLLLAQANNLRIILCVGETLDERDRGEAFDIVKGQITNCLRNFNSHWSQQLLVAYEPVWAIGTGKTATSSDAQEMHKFIRNHLGQLNLEAKQIPILYGGSVKPSNIKDLLGQNDINGALVGGASLNAEDFLMLCKISK